MLTLVCGGVSDLSRFIAAGRLNCSIDQVNGVVETNRPDAKNARYEAVVKQGDVLVSPALVRCLLSAVQC